MLAAWLVVSAPPPQERSTPLGPATISLFTEPAQPSRLERGNKAHESQQTEKRTQQDSSSRSASQQDALAAAEINIAFGRRGAVNTANATASDCFSLFWQQAHRVSSPSGRHYGYRSLGAGRNLMKGWYQPSAAGAAWAILRRSKTGVAYRATGPLTIAASAAKPASCPSLSGSKDDDEWCVANCKGPTPNCPSNVCTCGQQNTVWTAEQVGSPTLPPQSEDARSPRDMAAENDPWTTQEHVNCFNGYGGKGEPKPFSTNSSLVDCKEACFGKPKCQAVVVQGPVHEGWLRGARTRCSTACPCSSR